MPDLPISQLPELPYDYLQASDFVPVVDVSSGATKKLQAGALWMKVTDVATQAASTAAAFAAESASSATTSQTARTGAEAARDAALIQAGVYPDEPTGRAAVADGAAFKVQGSGGAAAYEYRRISSSTSTLLAVYPSIAAYNDLANRMSNNDAVVFGVTDAFGFSKFEVTDGSIKAKDVEISTSQVRFGTNTLDDVGDVFAWAIADEYGFVGAAVTADGKFLSSTISMSGGFSPEEIGEINTSAIASASSIKSTFNTEVARPVWDYNHFIMYGQSLGTGQEGWPALSKTAKHGNLMLGNCTRPVSGSSAAFDPVGGIDILQPLVAVVQDTSTGAAMSDSAVASLAAGAQNLGEDPLVGMVNFAKLQHNQRWSVLNDLNRKFIASNCGVSGRTIEQLSKGASPEIYLRMVDAATTVKNLADTEGKSYGVVGVAFLQGEYNYDTTYGGDATLAGYKAKLAQLYSDIEADIVSGISGQDAPPLFITYQTGAAYTRDDNGLAIGMAQWELAKERRNWVLASPVYPYTDKGGHLDPNGYRWVGKQFGKVWHRVVELGEDWEPLSPRTAVLRGKEILISFHVPAPPLVFDTPYVQAAAVDYAYKGFDVLDNGVSVALSSVEIVSDCVVRITLGSTPSGTVQVRYAGKATYNGNGNLRDSDATVADDYYEYTPGTGQYTSANIPSLVGKPYPLHNWCIAFQITAVAN